MFEVGQKYINRKGTYTVLAVKPPIMRVRYEDGTTADLKMAIQARIWENIQAEQEAAAAKRDANRRRGIGPRTQYFIKAVSLPSVTDFNFAGWPERVIMATVAETEKINQSDRIIYYAIEAESFIAVATITGEATEANPKDYFYTLDADTAFFFPVDVDAQAIKVSQGVTADSVELESQPEFRKLKLEPESFLKITEDDFELLAEILTEIAEEGDEDLDDEDYLEDDED